MTFPISSYSKKSLPYSTIILGLLIAFIFPLGLASTVENVDVLLAGIVIITLLWLWVYKQELLVKYFYWILISFWNLIDIFVLENWIIYLPNLRVFSYHTGSFFIRVVGFLVLIIFIILFDARHSKSHSDLSVSTKTSKMSDRIFALSTMAAYVLLIIALIDGLRNGYFATGAGSRYEYSMNASGLSQLYYPLLRLAIPIVAVNAQHKRNPAILLCYIIMFLGYLILIGNRFGALLITISLAFISYLFPWPQSNRVHVLSKKAVKVLCVCALLLLTYSLIQGVHERGSVALALENLFDRLFTGQGDVWWGIFALDSSGALHIDELGDELQAFNQTGISQIQFHFGIYKMMQLIAPDSVVEAYANLGIRFTSSTEATMYYYFGYAGVIASQVMIAWLASKLTNELIAACRAQDIVSIVCLGFLFNYALGAASMSEFYRLLTLPAIACYIVIAFTRTMRRPRWKAGEYRVGDCYETC